MPYKQIRISQKRLVFSKQNIRHTILLFMWKIVSPISTRFNNWNQRFGHSCFFALSAAICFFNDIRSLNSVQN